MVEPIQPSASVASTLRDDYDTHRMLFEAQPALVQRFLEAQGRQVGDQLAQHERISQVRFTLPERIVTDPPGQPVALPA
jgi:hypothetical protein